MVIMKRLRFLLFFILAGAFCVLTVSASVVYSAYCPFGDATYSSYGYNLTFNGPFAAGDKYYFDLSQSARNYFYDATGATVSANSTHVYTYTTFAPNGVSYDAASFVSEGNNRFWLYIQQDVSAITCNITVNRSLIWSPSSSGGTGTYNGYTVRSDLTLSASGLTKSISGPSLQSFDTKLDTIIELLQGHASLPRNLGNAVYTYFDTEYYTNLFVPGGADSTTDNGAFIASNGADKVGFYADTSSGRFYSGFLPAGTYFVVGSSSEAGDFVPIGVSFEGVDASKYTVTDVNYYRYNGAVYWYCVVTLRDNIIYNCVYWLFDGALNGMLYGGILAAPDDYVAGAALNPDQDQKTNDLIDAGNRQAGQERQLWQNINNYKSNISFGLDGWDDAVNGLAYVTNIFMSIWDNAPTQPIVLSLMLGIAMLSIGRGVSAAVRVSRNRHSKGD